MSNRILWILILFLFIVFSFVYWTFFYLPAKTEEKQKQEQLLQEQRKEILLVEVKQEQVEENKVELSSQEKIEELKKLKSFYKIIELENNKFYFSKKDNFLELKINEKIIWNFDLVPETELWVLNIYSSGDDFYILNWNKKYIYNQNTGLVSELDLAIDINYIKRSEDLYIIKTEKGSFVYDKTNKNLEYFNFFEDFVYYKDFYIWIINKDDDRRLKNLNLDSISWNSIFKYNPRTKEKVSLYETNLSLEKIYNLGSEIYFIDSNNKTYKLENLEQ